MPFTQEANNKRSLCKLGEKNPMWGKSGRVGMKHTPESLKKMSISQKKKWSDPLYKEKMKKVFTGRKGFWRGKHRLHMMGDKHWFWQGGKTEERTRIMQSLEYKLWRKCVFTRDNYTCVLCGCNKSGSLEADHIKRFSEYPELRFSVENGRTLCTDCHRQTNNYGRTKGTKNVI